MKKPGSDPHEKKTRIQKSGAGYGSDPRKTPHIIQNRPQYSPLTLVSNMNMKVNKIVSLVRLQL